MSGTERPSACENPEAECHRKPTRYVKWSEDYTSDTPWNEMCLCDPCSSILRRGTCISANELVIRPLGAEADG